MTSISRYMYPRNKSFHRRMVGWEDRLADAWPSKKKSLARPKERWREDLRNVQSFKPLNRLLDLGP